MTSFPCLKSPPPPRTSPRGVPSSSHSRRDLGGEIMAAFSLTSFCLAQDVSEIPCWVRHSAGNVESFCSRLPWLYPLGRRCGAGQATRQGSRRPTRLDERSGNESEVLGRRMHQICSRLKMGRATLKSVIPEPDAKADCTLQVTSTLRARVQPCEAASWGYFRAAKIKSEQSFRRIVTWSVLSVYCAAPWGVR